MGHEFIPEVFILNMIKVYRRVGLVLFIIAAAICANSANESTVTIVMLVIFCVFIGLALGLELVA